MAVGGCPFQGPVYCLDRLGRGMGFLETVGPDEFLVGWCGKTIHSQREGRGQDKMESSCT